MNKAVFVGRLTRDPEVRYCLEENSTAVGRFTVAVNRKYKREGEPTADFIPCVVFGHSAELVEKYFRQGMRVAVSGHIQTGSYTNKDGAKVYTTDLIIEDLEFAESRSEQEAGNSQQGYGNTQQNGNQQNYGANSGQNGNNQNYRNNPQGSGNGNQQNSTGRQNGNNQNYGNNNRQNVNGQGNRNNKNHRNNQQGYGNNGGQQNYGYSQSGFGDGFMNIPDGINEELPFN